MSIRVKLIVTYAILVLISVLVLVFSGIAIVTNVVQNLAETVIEENNFHNTVTQSIDLLAELKQAQDYEPQKLIDPDYIETLSTRTQFYNGGLIVRFENEMMNFSQLPYDASFYEKLVPSPLSHKRSGDDQVDSDHVIKHKDKTYFYIDYTFELDEGEVVYFFVLDLSKSDNLKAVSGSKFIQMILFILFIIITPLLFIITKDIITPLKKLEEGVGHIKNGNLDFKLTSNSNNEIGRVLRYFDVMRHELKVSIDKQVQFEENRKHLISSISHDLKTPITSIKGYIEGIREGVANTPEKNEKYLNVIYQKSQDMDQLIDDLFLFSKLDLNKLPFEMQAMTVADFFTPIVQEMKLEWENENRHLSFEVDDQIKDTTLLLDPQQMKRVFVNVLQNSMKYMDKANETIEIFVNDCNAHVQIVIKDNGMGIEKENLNQIFERFYRVEESRNQSAGGTGLGLAIAKQIIEQHGGLIHVTSEMGQGTKMIIDLKKHQIVQPVEGQTYD